MRIIKAAWVRKTLVRFYKNLIVAGRLLRSGTRKSIRTTKGYTSAEVRARKGDE